VVVWNRPSLLTRTEEQSRLFTDQRLYRARAFEPAFGINEIVCVLDQAGPLKRNPSPFFQVAGVEPVKLSPAGAGGGSHGVVLLYTQAAAVPAGYALAAGGYTNQNLAAGGTLKLVNSTTFQQGPKQLLQLRFNLMFLAIAGAKESDIDLQVYSPGSLPRFGTWNASPGLLNSIDQPQSPGDVTDYPAQGANATIPAAFSAVHPRDDANMREIWIWEINGPTWVIINNGGAAITGGSVGLDCWAYRYDLIALNPATWGPSKQILLYGNPYTVPADFRGLFAPTAPYAQTGTYNA
jgi:hypothetical protein